MGAGLLKRIKLAKELEKKFDSFDFRINPSDTFTFKERAKRELTGGRAPDEFIDKIYLAYKRFLIMNAVEIILSEKKPEEGKFIAVFTPPALVDEMWCLAILYSQKYRELCELLVGGVIDRVPNQKKIKIRPDIIRSVWPDYDMDLWNCDKSYTVWIYDKNLEFVMAEFYDRIKKLAIDTEVKENSDQIDNKLSSIHSWITSVCENTDMQKDEDSIPEVHQFYNSLRKKTPKQVYNYILKLIPKEVSTLLKSKLCIGKSSTAYIEEYAKFMTMIFFSKKPLTPSEEVDYVWHIHQSLTFNYRFFCSKVFGNFIVHVPTVGGQQESDKHSNMYSETLEFYKFLFKDFPPVGIWPSLEDRFDPNNFVGSWYSLMRIYFCILRVIEMHKNTQPKNLVGEILHCYFTWNEKSQYPIDLHNSILHELECSEIKTGCGSGCGGVRNYGGCGAGCGGVQSKNLTGCGAGCGGVEGKNYTGCGAGCGGVQGKNLTGCGAGCGGVEGKNYTGCGAGCGGVQGKNLTGCGAGCGGVEGKNYTGCGAGCGGVQGKNYTGCGAGCGGVQNENYTGCGAGCGGVQGKNLTGCGAGCGGVEVKNSTGCGAGCGGVQGKNLTGCGAGCGGVQNENYTGCGAGCGGVEGKNYTGCGAGCGGVQGKNYTGCGAGCGGVEVKSYTGCGAGCGGVEVKNYTGCGAGCGGVISD
jgi:hypothetical protein